MIESERLILRPWEARDREPFAALNADPEVMRYFPKRLDRKESDGMVARLQDRWRAEGVCFAVAERKADGAFLGMAGLAHLRYAELPAPCVEVGWRLARAYWGQGYATEAARAALAYGFEGMGLGEVVAIVVPDNHRSRAVMHRLGMVRDPARDFEHPALPEGHPLRPHLFYALSREAWQADRAGAEVSRGIGG